MSGISDSGLGHRPVLSSRLSMGRHFLAPHGRRVLTSIFTALLLVCGVLAISLGPAMGTAVAAPIASPQVYKFQAFANRVDDVIDEVRADFVLKVPSGYVDVTTGNLLTVAGKTLKIGYDFGDGSTRDMSYLNTLNGAAGATAWATNNTERFTIHQIMKSGDNDYLVISVDGDMSVPDGNPANNIPGGKATPLNWYFSLSSLGGNGWVPAALTKMPVQYNIYYGATLPTTITGPQIGMQFDGSYALWSGNQANWGQALDFGLNGFAPGILPPNSFAVDVINKGLSTALNGPAGSVSDSFWYAWVNEDGTLVKSINTAPIHITGVTPSNALFGSVLTVSKNTPTSGGPTLAYTAAQGAQGLTNKVGADGAIDFNNAGGTGYYKLLVWPESHNPTTVTVDNGAPLLSYTAASLFDATGALTPGAVNSAWPVASTFYKYQLPLPAAPVITTPVNNSRTNINNTVTISGTGTPGHTITLKIKPSNTITDDRDPALTLIKDGDHAGVQPGDIVVDASGNWTYTYTPSPVLVDGPYTVIAFQTEQGGDLNLTSPPSNPDVPASPTKWGVTFTIDVPKPVKPTVEPTSDAGVARPSALTPPAPELTLANTGASPAMVWLAAAAIGAIVLGGGLVVSTTRRKYAPRGR